MSSSKYFIKIKNQYGVPVLNVNEFYNLEMFRSEYGVGSLYIDFPLENLLVYNIATDWRIEVYRRTGGGNIVRVGDTQWLIKLVRYKVDEQNEASLHILAYDAMYILDRRVIAYVDKTPYTSKTMPADNMLKAFVRENLGSLAVDYKRDLSEWLVVEPDRNEAPEVTKDGVSFQKILPVLNDICELSNSAGTYLSYDIVYDESIGKLVFKTYTGQRGVNRGSNSTSPIYLAHHTDPVNVMGSSLNYASVEIDASDEASYVYSGRQSEEVNAVFAEIENTLVTETGPFARAEDFITTGSSTEYNDVMTEAHAWLQHKYRNLILNAHVQETNDLQFGLDYGFGDVLAFRYLGTTIDIHLDEFKITIDGDGKEELSIISTNMEKELLVKPLTGLDDLPLVHNEPIEEEESRGASLFYKYHTIAQSFKYSEDTTLDYIKVFMRRSGNPERGVTASLRLDNGGVPGAEIAGSTVYKAYDTLADGVYTWARFAFSQPISITANQTYWISLTCGIAKGAYENYYLIGVDPQTRYQGGVMRVSKDGKNFETFTQYEPSEETWVNAGVDIPFKTYKNASLESHETVNSFTTINETTTKVAQQIFLPAAEITDVRLSIRKTGGPNDFVVTLNQWDFVNNIPGAQLSTASVRSSLIGKNSFEWYDFIFPASIPLSGGKLYCIVMSATGFDTGDYYDIATDSNKGYTPGAAFKFSGGAWSSLNADAAFAIYKLAPDISFTTMTNENPLDVGKRNHAILQTFSPTSYQKIFKAGVYLAKVGSPTHNLTVEILEMDGEKPGESVLTGFTIPPSAVSEYFSWYEAALNGTEIYPEKTYCIRATYSKNENNYYVFKCDANMTYGGGVGMVDLNGTLPADSDMLFRIGRKLP